jgi:enoyl-ACP reductase-like protein
LGVEKLLLTTVLTTDSVRTSSPHSNRQRSLASNLPDDFGSGIRSCVQAPYRRHARAKHSTVDKRREREEHQRDHPQFVGDHATSQLEVARDLAAAGIRVNTVAPGLIDTPIYGEGEVSEAFKAKLGESVLFPHRLGRPDELASMVVELVTNSYMNAEIVRVDGGIRMPPK